MIPLDIIATLIPIFGIIFLGALAYYSVFLTASLSIRLNQFTYKVVLPFLVFNQLVRIESGEFSSKFIYGILLAIIVTYIVAYGISLFLLKNTSRKCNFNFIGKFL